MSIKLWSKPEDENHSFMPKATNATLDDLFSAANEIGEVEIGGSFSKNSAEIKIHCELGHFYVKCKKYDTVKENLAECIHRARHIERAIKDY